MTKFSLKFRTFEWATFLNKMRLISIEPKTNAMKYLKLIAICCILASQTLYANGKIVLEDKKENYTQTETGYILKFNLVATKSEVTEIKDKVSDLSDRLTLDMTQGQDNSNNCIFTVNHQNQPEYVHKMLLMIGIDSIEFKGETLPLANIIDILYSFLK